MPRQARFFMFFFFFPTCKDVFCLSVKSQIGALKEKSIPSTLIGAVQTLTEKKRKERQ